MRLAAPEIGEKMTTQQWNEYGYEVVEDEGFVYLIREELGVGYRIAEQNGSWINYENVNRLPWRFIDLRNYPKVVDILHKKSLKACA